MIKSLAIIIGSFFVGIVIGVGAIVIEAYCSKPEHEVVTDQFIREHVIMLYGNNTTCTGFEVNAPSGKVFTLTAGHCYDTLTAGKVMFITEHGGRGILTFVTKDDMSDSMLLSGMTKHGFTVAPKIDIHEHIRAFGHGKGAPTFQTEGEVLLRYVAPQGLGCNPVICPSGSEGEMLMSVPLMPGMSGGPIIDNNGDVAGMSVAYNAMEPFFTYGVNNDTIKELLKGR